jgi:hypothetical protein
VNGKYKRNGVFRGTGKYTKPGMWENQQNEFTLYRYNSSTWYISFIPLGKQPGEDGDIDIYYAPAPASSAFPPEQGWAVDCEGEAPPPQVTVKYEVPKVPIIKPVTSAYREILLEKEFSDCMFVCPDGQVIPAHKCILAASSPYFKAAFGGQWKDTDELHTTHPAHIIKAMLTMLYTGDTSSVSIKEDPFAFMGLASEYSLEWLKKMVEYECVKSLDVSHLKDCWCAARLYDSSYLKNACVEFTRKHALTVLASNDITRLQIEDPASWKEFTEAISKET